MENWKQERYNEINRAIERIQRRAEKVLQAINTLHNEDQQQHQQQQLQPQPQPQPPSRPRSQRQQRSQHQQDQRQEDQQDQQHRRRQQQQKVSNLTSELARLQDMNDRLLDFRDRLCFYSNLGYVESLNEWQYEIRKICVKAEGFAQCSHHRHNNHNHDHRRQHHTHHHSAGPRRNNNEQDGFQPLLPLMN